MVRVPGFFKDYALLADTTPIQDGTEEIAKGWMDSEGNAWFQVYATITSGPKKNMKLQVPQKISEAGTVLEFIWRKVSAFKPNEFPKMIDKEYACHYGRYVRTANE